uniref:Ribitol-5-phosphate transferase FKTN N-terminal domain-containing protein n=1 Tax=Timema bartmani TaxID=61472 RepID=A0A7R9F3Y7_9NEOP|nr:unnamed protein product [Timema bartmani]
MRRKSAMHLCLIGGLILLATQLILLILLVYPRDQHDETFPLEDIITFINITSNLQLPVIMVDSAVLEHHANQKRRIHEPCVLCRAKHPVTFLLLYRRENPFDEFMLQLRNVNFQISIFFNIDPPELPADIPNDSPICYFIKRKTVIHLVLLHKREGNYWWYAGLNNDPRAESNLKGLGLSFYSLQAMKTEGALDKFETEHVSLDGISMLVPKDVPRYLREAAGSKFVECGLNRAREFQRIHGKNSTYETTKFSHRAWKLLSRAKTILDKLGIRFWISSGTCLGYFRQCSIISHSKDVDIGVFITDYSEKIMSEFISRGFTLKHWFGKINDSLELSFLSGDIKLDIFFFYEEEEWMWNGGTQAKTGKKFKYLFPRFTLCWTEFLELKVRVPCETRAYIEANYGPDWFTPVIEWDWKSSPPNVQLNGLWPVEEWPHVIQVYN